MTITCSSYTPPSHTANYPYENIIEGMVESLKEMKTLLLLLCQLGILIKKAPEGKKHLEILIKTVKGPHGALITKVVYKYVTTENSPEKKNLPQLSPIDTTCMTFDSLMLCMGGLGKIFASPKDSKKLEKACENIETTIESTISTMPPKELSSERSMEQLFPYPHRPTCTYPFSFDHTSKAPYFPLKIHTKVDL